MELPEEIKKRLDLLIANFNQLSKRQKINLAAVAFVGVMVIIAFFFVKSSFGKLEQPDRSLIEEMQRERDSLKTERRELQLVSAELRYSVQQRDRRDSMLLLAVQRQQASLQGIYNNLKNLNNAYKKPSDFDNISGDSLKKFFTDLK